MSNLMLRLFCPKYASYECQTLRVYVNNDFKTIGLCLGALRYRNIYVFHYFHIFQVGMDKT
jgi:hypothetical protein